MNEAAVNENNDQREDSFDMGAILDKTLGALEQGKVIKAKVLKVANDKVVVDIGYKSDGTIPIKEFANSEGISMVKAGDEVEVFIENVENNNGVLVLSKMKADRFKYLDQLEKAFREKDIIDGKLLKKVNGGYMVTIGVEVFLPLSQIAAEDAGSSDNLIGKVLPVKIIKFGRKKGEIVVSHKLAFRDKSKRLKKEIWDKLKEGDIVKGIVKSLTSYGAFIDIGGLTGLLHISDMQWGKVSHPAEILAIDSEIEVKVIKIDIEMKRVSFGLKQLKTDPWINIEEKYPCGSVIKGKIVNIVEYGAFIKLEEGIEGLLHISDLSWTKRVKSPLELLAIGDSIEVKVINVDKESRKILFGLKQLEMDPFEGIEEKFGVYAKVEAVVTGYSGSKIFLELSEGVEGVLHKKDISWTKKNNILKGMFRKGERLTVVILNIDKPNRKVNVGIKQLTQDPWINDIPQKFKQDTVVSGKVTGLTNYGVFVEVDKEIEGFIHISELSGKPVEKIEDLVKIGNEIQAKIIKVDIENRKISLSIKEHVIDTERKELSKYTDLNDAKSTFGDLLNKK